MSEQSGHRDPPYTVDAVIEKDGQIVLIRRGREPFKGKYALPGGHVDKGEAPEDAVVREVYEETGLDVAVVADLGDYSGRVYDPRYEPDEFDHRAYVCETRGSSLNPGDDASGAEWVSPQLITSLMTTDRMAFNHEAIIGDYFRWKEQD